MISFEPELRWFHPSVVDHVRRVYLQPDDHDQLFRKFSGNFMQCFMTFYDIPILEIKLASSV
jgi:hypothetical protein